LKPDYYDYFKTQDTVPVGKVGIFATALIMPENHSHAFFHNIVHKIFKVIVPWPFRVLALKDNGVALLDPHHVHAREKFEPTSLEDAFGNDRDLDGTPYIERYKQVRLPGCRLLHAYILIMVTSFTKAANAENHPLPARWLTSRVLLLRAWNRAEKAAHWVESFKIINGAFERIQQKYKNVECRSETNMFLHEMKQKLHELLDAGCETYSSLLPWESIPTLRNSTQGSGTGFIYRGMEHKHPGKKIKVIIGPQMGNYQPLRQAFLEMLKDRLDTIPEGSSVLVGVTVHGMPWDMFSWEAWLQLAPPYRDKLFEEVKELVKKYKFSKTDVVICQDEFSDPIWDPKQKYLSTNRAYWKAINEGYDYAIGLPIEFFAENSDTLMHHAKSVLRNSINTTLTNLSIIQTGQCPIPEKLSRVKLMSFIMACR